MNRYKLMDQGYTWDEADELLDRYAEDQRDSERDQQLLEQHERAEYSRQLEDFSRS